MTPPPTVSTAQTRTAVQTVTTALRRSPQLVAAAVRSASVRQVLVAVLAAAAVGGAIGLVTVLIPNSLFGREIAPVAWNYPVLVLTAILSGLLAATYVRAAEPAGEQVAGEQATGGAASSRLATIGVVTSWFAVGCPVCNKIAVLALGYSGALSWFAPAQPILAVAGLLLLWTALAVRLQNAAACPLPAARSAATSSR